MKRIQERLNNLSELTKKWVQDKYMQIALFNIAIVILVLLRSAGYFEPYFQLTINLIVFIGIALSVVLLGARSREIFIVALLFWLFVALLRTLGINIWAERAAVYTYQALVVAVILMFYENIKRKND